MVDPAALKAGIGTVLDVEEQGVAGAGEVGRAPACIRIVHAVLALNADTLDLVWATRERNTRISVLVESERARASSGALTSSPSSRRWRTSSAWRLRAVEPRRPRPSPVRAGWPT